MAATLKLFGEPLIIDDEGVKHQLPMKAYVAGAFLMFERPEGTDRGELAEFLWSARESLDNLRGLLRDLRKVMPRLFWVEGRGIGINREFVSSDADYFFTDDHSVEATAKMCLTGAKPFLGLSVGTTQQSRRWIESRRAEFTSMTIERALSCLRQYSAHLGEDPKRYLEICRVARLLDPSAELPISVAIRIFAESDATRGLIDKEFDAFAATYEPSDELRRIHSELRRSERKQRAGEKLNIADVRQHYILTN